MGENAYIHDENNKKIPKGVVNVKATDSITKLHVGALRDNTILKSIILPATLQSINSFAFHGCRSLKSIRIPETATLIGDSAFHSCTALQQIIFLNNEKNYGESSMNKIGFEAFRNCSSLKSFEIPKSSDVRKVDSWCCDCISLQNVIIPDTIEEIGFNAFKNCTSLKSLVLPPSIHTLDNNAFFNCSSIKAIFLPESLRLIGRQAFGKCSSLTIVAFPDDFSRFDWNINTFFGIGLLDSTEIRSWLWLKNSIRFENLPLHHYCYHNAYSLSLESLAAHVEKNVDAVTKVDDLGMTALHLLCCSSRITLEMINKLLSLAPDVDSMKNIYGMTPLMQFIACHVHLFYDSKFMLSARWPLSNLIKRNEETSLYPFMVAACTKKCRLEEVYYLTIQFPGLISQNSFGT